MSKLLVLYIFHEYNDRVKHFIKTCIFRDANVDFIMIANDKTFKGFNVPDYVKTLTRDNIGYDFGGWSDALLTNDLYKKYDKFIFVNSSVIGPFIPSYSKVKWTDIYLNGLQNNVKLFGSTINACDDPINKSHVQSYIFAMNKETLQYLIHCKIFSMIDYSKTLYETVWNREVLMSRKIIEKKWNIGSLLPLYKNVDFTCIKPENKHKFFKNDIMKAEHKDVLWNVYDLVFVKGNRINAL